MRSGSAPGPAPWIALVGLGFVAAGLALIGLGDLPLRDFDEATVARVALELRHGLGEAPLLPTLWDGPYLNKAPGLHSLIALVISATTQPDQLPSEWTIRLAPALLSCLVVPLGGWLQWTLRPGDRSSAIATSLILLTLMPVARHGRLAMLDGAQLTAMALLWLALLQLNRRHCSGLWGAVAGLMASAMLLLKAPLLVPSAVAAGLALVWGKEWKNWNHATACTGMLLGLAPGIGWHLWHAHIRGSEALWLWGGDGAGRVLLDAGEGSDLGWRVPIIEVLEGGWPWLPLVPFALAFAWRYRKSRWGQWSLASLLTLAGAILPLRTQLPWYSHPLWLPIALLCAPLLVWLVEQPSSSAPSSESPDSPRPPGRWLLLRLPMFWSGLGLLLLLLWLGSFSSIGSSLAPYRGLAAVLGLGWCFGGWWLRSDAPRQRRLGLISLTCGNVATLALLFHSPLWLWELNETWPVQPVAALARDNPGAGLTLKGYDERPSLNWYAEQRIPRFKGDAGRRLSDKPQEGCLIEGQSGRWILADCR